MASQFVMPFLFVLFLHFTDYILTKGIEVFRELD